MHTMNSLWYRNLYYFLFSFPGHTGSDSGGGGSDGMINIMAGAFGGALIVTLIIIVLLLVKRRRRLRSVYDEPTTNNGTAIEPTTNNGTAIEPTTNNGTAIFANPTFGVPAGDIHNDDVVHVYEQIADRFQEEGSSHNNDVYVEMHG